jgi:hypothetical protein
MPPQKTSNNGKFMKTSLLIALCFVSNLLIAQDVTNLFKIPDNAAQELPVGVPRTVNTNGRVVFINTMFTTRAFQQEGLKLVTEEANRAAAELNLPEVIPITESNIVQAFISPFGFTYETRMLGNITTSNYCYGVERDYKFNQVTITEIDNHCRQYAEKYQWPLSRLDTNAAFQLATQWLSAVHTDVQKLNRDCVVHVVLDPYWNDVKLGQLPKDKFTPIYYLWWSPKGSKGVSDFTGASVELFLPTKTLLSLSVKDPKYVLRPPVVFTNLAALFPGKGIITTNSQTEPIVVPGTSP